MRIDNEVNNNYNYIPILSTVTNFVHMFEKASMKNTKVDLKDRHYIKLEAKSYGRCALAMIPVLGNIVIGIWDFAEKRSVLAAVKKDGLQLRNVSERLRDNKDVVLAAVKQNPLALLYLNKQTATALIQEHPELFKNMNETTFATLCSIEWIALPLIQQKIPVCENISKETFQNVSETIQNALIQVDPSLLQYASKKMQDDYFNPEDEKEEVVLRPPPIKKPIHVEEVIREEIIPNIVKKEEAPPELTTEEKSEPQVSVEIQPEYETKLMVYGKEESERLLNLDKKEALEKVKENGLYLQHISSLLKNDHEIVRAAAENNPASLLYANYYPAWAVIKENPALLKYAKEEVQVRIIKQESRILLKFASEEVKNNEALIRFVIQDQPFLLQYASKEMQEKLK